MIVLSIAALIFAAIPALMFLANLPLFAFPSTTADGDAIGRTSEENVSVLVPARDEADGIENCVRAALASQNVNVEVVVLDDHSTDATAEITQRMQSGDSRVRYVAGAELPDGWNGKQHACKQLAESATHDRMLFIDADVRLNSNAIDRLVRRQDATGVKLLSAFPHQETFTWLERWLIPMMHYVLLGFLPFRRMRESEHPAYAAGCGQLFLTRRSDYIAAGTHAAIQGSRHDGVKLPRAFRSAGLMTDVVDGTDLGECRMYHNAAEVVRGVLKNATEGIANPKLIVPFSVFLLGANVLPLVALAWSLVFENYIAAGISLSAVAIGHFPRSIAAIRFRQSWWGVCFHSVATALFVVLQWTALLMSIVGKQVTWRGRA